MINKLRPYLKTPKPKSKAKDKHERTAIASLAERRIPDQIIISKRLKCQNEESNWKSKEVAGVGD